MWCCAVYDILESREEPPCLLHSLLPNQGMPQWNFPSLAEWFLRASPSHSHGLHLRDSSDPGLPAEYRSLSKRPRPSQQTEFHYDQISSSLICRSSSFHARPSSCQTCLLQYPWWYFQPQKWSNLLPCMERQLRRFSDWQSKDRACSSTCQQCHVFGIPPACQCTTVVNGHLAVSSGPQAWHTECSHRLSMEGRPKYEHWNIHAYGHNPSRR